MGLREGSAGVLQFVVSELDWDAPFPESPAGQVLVQNLSDRLFDLAGRDNLRPNLVRSHSRSLDEKTWKFELQKGRLFHNGDEVTADDVIYTLQLDMLNPRSTVRLADVIAGEVETPFGECRGIRKVSRSRFEVLLKDRCGDFLERLATAALGIRCRRAASEGQRVFSGPYELVERRDDFLGVRLRLDHPAAEVGCFPEVHVRILAQTRDAVSSLRSSSACLVSGFTSQRDFSVSPSANRIFFSNAGTACYAVFRKETPNLEAVRSWLQNLFMSKKSTTGFLAARGTNSLFPSGSLFFSPVDTRGRQHFAAETEEEGAQEGSPVLVFPPSELGERARRLANDGGRRLVDATSRKIENPDGEFRVVPLNDGWAEAELRRTFLSNQFLRGFSPLPWLKQLEKLSSDPNPQTRASHLRVLFRDLVADTGIVPLWFAPTVLFLSDDLDYARVESSGWPLRFTAFRKHEVVTREDVQAARLEAIARTTQMFAHDVRKPFSMLKMALDAVETCSDPHEIAQIVRRMVPEVQRAMASVDGMIADIMEIGSDTLPVRETAHIETFVESSLNEVFRIHRDCQISFDYEFGHFHLLSVDPLKVSRVFSNIIGNAVQAMSKRGKVWFRTREIYENGVLFVEVCIGNSNSHIEKADLDRVFEAFFTKGKKGGTGLGLAIAEKIVVAHGGRIRASSQEGRGVEFFFTLPASHKITNRDNGRRLPRHSQDIERNIAQVMGLAPAQNEIQQNEMALVHEMSAAVKAARRRIRFLCIDDESLYRNAMHSLLTGSDAVAALVDVHMAKSSETALNLCKNTAFDAIVCDIDLGPESMDGFELVQRLRENGSRAQICIHSNRSLPQDFKTAIDAGANAFLPKPMSRAHLLRLLAEAARNMGQTKECRAGSAPEVALVEDSSLVRAFWKRKLQGVTLHAFRSPAEFWAKVDRDEEFLERLACVVTDYMFEEPADENGLEFAAKLRPRLACPIFLCSEASFERSRLAGVVDAVLEKDPPDWSVLESRIAKVHDSRRNKRSEG